MRPDYDTIAARLTAATDGPWESAAASSYLNGKPKLDEWFVRRVEDDVSIAADIIDPATSQPSEANAAFIAAAPTDIAALLARCLLLEAVADAMPGVLEWAADPEVRSMLKDPYTVILDADLERARDALTMLDAAPVVV